MSEKCAILLVLIICTLGVAAIFEAIVSMSPSVKEALGTIVGVSIFGIVAILAVIDRFEHKRG